MAHRTELGRYDAMEFGHWMLAFMETDGVTATARPAIGETVRWLDESMSKEEPLWHQPFELPKGKTKTVAEVVEGLHLNAFVNAELDDEGEI